MWSVIYLLILVVSGFAISAGLARRASRLETLTLTLCMGPGLMGYLLILISMMGFRPGRGEILLIAALLLLAAGIVIRKIPRGKDETAIVSQRTPSWWIGVSLLAIAYGFMSVAIDALMYPTIEWDGFAIWQLKAKVLAIYAMNPRPDYFTNLTLSYSHLRYPVLLPMISAGMYAMKGRLDDSAKIISLIFYSGTLLSVFGAVKRINGTTAAFAAAMLLACVQPFLRYGGTGTAEMAITAFYTCSLLCLLLWRQSRQWGVLILAAIFSAWMSLTKNEGLALSLISAIVIAASGPREQWKKSLAAAAAFAAIVAVMYFPWIVFSWGLPRTDEDYVGRLASLQIFSEFGRLGEILVGFGKELINWENWGVFWVIVLLMVLTERRRFKNPLLAMVGILLVLHILAYIPEFMVTNWKLEELLSVTTDRLLMHAAPAGAILVGLLWPKWAGGTQG